MKIEREYPDIEFVETSTEVIESNMIALYEEMMKQSGKKHYKVYPASPERLFIAWCAAIIVQQRVLINETAKKNVPRYAKGNYLDSLAELFKDVKRLPATPAIAKFRCYISMAQNQSVIIPKGTRITFDGEIIFETTEELEIKAGETYVEVNGKCQTPGIIGNNLAPGQVKEIVDVYDYYLKAENITKTEGGAEIEGDTEYYERMRESMESFSTAGPINAYIYHAKSVSAAIADVAATSPEPGIVDIRILLQNGEQPTQAILQEIEAALNASDIRPLTDVVTVSMPEEDIFELDVSFFVGRNEQISTSIIERDIKTAVEDYIRWQTGKMGRDINPSYLIQLMMATGVKRVEVRKPIFKVVEDTHVARINRNIIRILNGGVEDA